MPVALTSKQAFYTHPDKNAQEHRILLAVRASGERGNCIADLARSLNIDKSTVSARFNSLKKSGAVVLVGKFASKSTGIKSEFWRAKQTGEMVSLPASTSKIKTSHKPLSGASLAASVLATRRHNKRNAATSKAQLPLF